MAGGVAAACVTSMLTFKALNVTVLVEFALVEITEHFQTVFINCILTP